VNEAESAAAEQAPECRRFELTLSAARKALTEKCTFGALTLSAKLLGKV